MAPPTTPTKTTLTRAQVDHVAKLASLSLTEGEAEAFTAELASILAYVEQLDSLDTSSVAPTTAGGGGSDGACGGGGPWRADEIAPGLSHEDALAAAPRTAAGGFAVPGFVDSGASSATGGATGAR